MTKRTKVARTWGDWPERNLRGFEDWITILVGKEGEVVAEASCVLEERVV